MQKSPGVFKEQYSDRVRKNFFMTLRQMAMLSLNLMVGAAVGLPGGASGQQSAPSEYQMKAAFLYNFAKFVEWPPAVLPENSTLVIGVLGDDPFDATLENTIRNKNVAGHPITCRRIKSPNDVKGCHILFISSSEKKRWPEISGALAGSSVLTVGENWDNFTDTGGMIYFFMDDRRVCFDINAEAARRASLSISSKLMLLRKKPAAQPGIT
jgi:hypothetical protein